MNKISVMLVAILISSSAIGIAYAISPLGTGSEDVWTNSGNRILLDGEFGDDYVVSNGNVVIISQDGTEVRLPNLTGSDTFALVNTQQTFSRPLTASGGDVGATGIHGIVNMVGSRSPGLDNNRIASSTFSGYNSNGDRVQYGTLQVTSEVAAAGLEEGGLRYNIRDTPGSGTQNLFLSLNIGANDRVNVHKDLQVDGDIIGVSGMTINPNGDLCLGTGC